MAANQPTVLMPVTGETGIRLDDVLMFLKSPYSGAGTQRELRVQVSTVNSFPSSSAIIDTSLRENDDRAQGDDWAELQLAMYGLAASTLYYLSCMVRNTSNEPSSWASSVSFTTEADPLTAATWTAGQ